MARLSKNSVTIMVKEADDDKVYFTLIFKEDGSFFEIDLKSWKDVLDFLEVFNFGGY